LDFTTKKVKVEVQKVYFLTVFNKKHEF